LADNPKSRVRRAGDLGASMSVAIIATWLLEQSGIEVPGEITAAIAALIGFAGSAVSDYLDGRDSGGPPSGGGSAMVASLALLLVGGCATAPASETPAQRLAHVDAQFAAAVDSAVELRQQGVLSADQVRALEPKIQRGAEALDRAWRLLCLAPSGAGGAPADCSARPEDALEAIRIVNKSVLPGLHSALEEAQR